MEIKNKQVISRAVNKKPKFSVAIQSDAYKKLINNTLQDKTRAQNFIANISSAVANNRELQECDPATILSAGLMTESLNLSLNNQIGHAYLIPFKDNKNNRTVAQFQLGYKGYLQLAMRSGQYKKINVLAIKGELIKYDPLEEIIEVKLIEDEFKREKAKTTGYYAFFEYHNGFKKSLYWSREKMEAHALKYSQGYRAKKGFTFWEKDFDAMAIKTLIRQLISKWGIMSVEMQDAYIKDMGVIEEDGNVEYIDNTDTDGYEETPQQTENNKSTKATPKEQVEVVEEEKVEEYKGEF
ncbi:MAG TPA: recombinase [Gallicola sp.]|nr:recombinase [Gallicola sp.]